MFRNSDFSENAENGGHGESSNSYGLATAYPPVYNNLLPGQQNHHPSRPLGFPTYQSQNSHYMPQSAENLGYTSFGNSEQEFQAPGTHISSSNQGLQSSKSRESNDKTPASRSRKAREKSHIWEKHKEIIRQFYLDDHHTFQETRQMLITRHNFTVSENEFKKKMKEWGFPKNINKERAWMLNRARTRKVNENKDTVFCRGGKIIPITPLQERAGNSIANLPIDKTLDEPTPPGIFYSTPLVLPPSPPTIHGRRPDTGSQQKKAQIAYLDTQLAEIEQLLEGGRMGEHTENMLRDIIEKYEASGGDVKLQLFEARNRLLVLLRRLGRKDDLYRAFEDAQQFYEENIQTLKSKERKVAEAAARMASLFLKADLLDKAEGLFDGLQSAMEVAFGIDHAITIGVMISIALTYQNCHRWPDARSWYERALSALLGHPYNNHLDLVDELESAIEYEHFDISNGDDLDWKDKATNFIQRDLCNSCISYSILN